MLITLTASLLATPGWQTCSPSDAVCEDHLPNCSAMARAGKCYSDPATMDAHCRKSCGRCYTAVPTACPSTNATCCAHPFSSSGLGCCPMPNAVCCNDYTCCPAGHHCEDSGSGYSINTKCVSTASNNTGLQICKPGPALPLAADRKNCLIIGDSVSIGCALSPAN